jgi:hypothetical protein
VPSDPLSIEINVLNLTFIECGPEAAGHVEIVDVSQEPGKITLMPFVHVEEMPDAQEAEE